MRSVLAIGCIMAACCVAGHARADAQPPVKAVVDGRIAVKTPVGEGLLPIALSQDWPQPLPGIARAVIIVHGYSRNADEYFKAIAELTPDSSTLVLAPQFLTGQDLAAHSLADRMLRWNRDQWSGGGDAEAPAPVSSFEAIDSLLLALADRTRLPDLRIVVLAGFSAGGQLVQRYAAVGQGVDKVTGAGIALRYVVGSPSSYLYFSNDRPLAEGGFGPFGQAGACPGYNDWKYGFAGGLPRYAQPALKNGAAALERRYAGLDVIYLLGTADNDPNHRVLDKSCAADAQGPHRYGRGLAYFAQLQARSGASLKHRLWLVRGVAHQHAQVFGSPCGRTALFDASGCLEN